MQDNSFKYTDAISLNDRTSHALLFSLAEKDAKVLEFGCGTGLFAELLRDKLGCTVTGIELSPEAAELARGRLFRVLCLDAEDTAWEMALAGETFDTVIVSDLLEHLKDPVALLRRVSPFLSENGKILFSVPNVAHADVLAALSDNRFDYTEKGLLDNTHLRFFAEKNLPAFFDAADLHLTYLDATVCEAGATEQRTSGLPAATLRLLSEGPSALAYQFVGIAHKKDYAARTGLSFHSNIPLAANGGTMRAVIDTGTGFDGDEILLPSPTAKEDAVLLLPEGARRLRLFVRREHEYLIHSPRFLLSGKEVSPSDSYGVLPFGDSLLLTENGAYLEFDISHKEGTFCFSGEVSPIASDAVWQNTLKTADTLAALQADVLRYADECEKAKQTVAKEKKALAALEEKLAQATAQITDLQNSLSLTKQDYTVVTSSKIWRITKPFRATLDAIKRILRKIPLLVKLKKGLSYLFKHGIRSTRLKLRERSRARKSARKAANYSKEKLQNQRNHKFEKEILFSVLVPLYNTPQKFLAEMIASVQAQTYAHWELCLADGSDDAHEDVGKYCLAHAAKDRRIKYRKLEKNLGISDNTNACIDMATGDFIALFDHDDILHPAALYEFMCAIEDGADFVYTDEATFESPSLKKIITLHHKPDFAIDNLRANNYICHFSAFSREVLEAAGRFRRAFDGSQDHDMILRLCEKAKKVVHIPKILYFWRSHPLSVAMDINSKTYAIEAGKAAVKESIERSTGMQATVESSRAFPTIYRVKYDIQETERISIIIPNKDHLADLKTCLDSVFALSTYKNYEVIIIDNGSSDPALFAYYEQLKEEKSNVKILSLDIPFNYPRLNNAAAEAAEGKYLIFLNNDIKIITPAWMEELLMYAQRPDVGAVGAMLYYPNNTVQHAGIILGLGAHRVAGHAFHMCHRSEVGYMGRLCYAQNMSAVTAACMMVKASVFKEVGGFCEEFAVAYNDVDLCLKIREAGHLIVWTPYAEAYHYESRTRGAEDASPQKLQRFNDEVALFKEKWESVLVKGDPYYNPNFSLDHSDFRMI